MNTSDIKLVKIRQPKNNDEIAHYFANKILPEAGKGALYYRNNIIYSYGSHFAIAKHVENGLLFTTRSYSISTAKQKNIVWNATRHLNVIYCPYPDGLYKDNFDYWSNEIEEILKHLKTARKPEKYLLEVERVKTQIIKYTEFFNLSIPEPLKVLLNVTNTTEYRDYLEVKKDAILKEEKERLQRIKVDAAREVKEFRKFKRHSVYNFNDNMSYLRYNVKSQRVETSQRVEIPVKIALNFYNWILEVKECKNCDKKILEYNVTEINSKFIIVGCHKIKMSEIKRVLKDINSK